MSSAGRLIAGRYALDSLLGRGGMGVVWRARDTLLDRQVAVKEVELAGEDLAAVRERSLREARLAARLNHPNVVTLYDVIEDDGRLYLVMELVEAPTLRDIVEANGPGSPARVATVGLELLDALVAAHRAGIVHRDVKPSNVMVAVTGRVKLTDFGIAALQDETQRTRTSPVGSAPFMAPEQAEGRRTGPATDMWGLGATLYYAVEGVPPFGADGSVATLHAIVTEAPRWPERAGPLIGALGGLFAKSPDHRTTADVLREQLEAIVHASASPGHALVSAPGDLSSGPPLAPTKVYTASAPWPTAATTPAHDTGSAPAPPAPPRRRRGFRRVLLWVAAGIGTLLVISTVTEEGRARSGPPGIGDPARDGNFEFVVTSFRCDAQSVGSGLFSVDAAGQFCLVELSVRNVKQDSRNFGLFNQKLLRSGDEFSPDVGATIAANGSARLISTDLNPGMALRGTLVFDVPADAEPDAVKLHDSVLSGGVRIELR